MHQDVLLLPKQGQNGKKPARFLIQGNYLFCGPYSTVCSETETLLISKGFKKKQNKKPDRHLLK